MADPTPADLAPTSPESAANQLLAQLVELLTLNGVTVLGPDSGQFVVIPRRDDELPEIVVSAEPGALVGFAALLDPVPVARQAEAVAMLTSSAPIPDRWARCAWYGVNPSGEIGLVLDLAMPETFSPELVIDALEFADETLRIIFGA